MSKIARSAQKIPGPKYLKLDISDELYREVIFAKGQVYRIDRPVYLIIRKGGTTHRVIDSKGVVHCYGAPETGNTVIRWVVKPGTPHVAF